jgi:hypothetical protein
MTTRLTLALLTSSTLLSACGGTDDPPDGWQELHVCRGSDPRDALRITSLEAAGDSLFVEVAHGGGCEDHEYGLCYEDAWADSLPVQVSLRVLHDANDDGCDAGLQAELTFDLSALREAYAESYQSDSGAIQMNFSDCDPGQLADCSALYRFGCEDDPGACPDAGLGSSP